MTNLKMFDIYYNLLQHVICCLLKMLSNLMYFEEN